MTTENPTPQLPPGQIEVAGAVYLKDAKGALVPIETVRAQDLLQDELVRKIVGYAEPLQAEIARFREHCFDDIDAFVDMLDQQYGAKRGGTKGNITVTTYDGLLKVTVAVADLITYGPELQTAKSLIDECVREWSQDGRVEIRALIDRVFNVGKGGIVDRTALIQLTRVEIADERWERAMKAIRESFKPIGSKRYVQIHRRERPDARWEHVSIDMAKA